MKRFFINPFLSLPFLVLVGLSATSAVAQRAGQNVSVQYGTVQAGREVELQSNAVPAGAIVGGSLGLLSAKGKSSGSKARNVIIGGVAGSAIAGASKGSNRGMLYEVDLGASGLVQVVTDQREIRTGDCVAVEKAGDTANLRRVTSAYCNPENAAAVTSVADETREEAEECLAAKQQLMEAESMDALELAKIKIELLCDD